MLFNTIADVINTRLLEKGKEGLHGAFPRDFELYMCALELVSPDGETIDYFSFPIMPKNISKTETEATSIQYSLGGVTIVNRTSFIPKELSISGDFGRMFKFTMFEMDGYYRALRYSMKSGYYSAADITDPNSIITKSQELPAGIKSGYGCIKVLQSIIDKAKAFDENGRTFRLYFYNQALGESYLVVPTKNPLHFDQSVGSSNMIWQYKMNLTIIADLKNVFVSDKGVRQRALRTYGIINKSINTLGSVIKIIRK